MKNVIQDNNFSSIDKRYLKGPVAEQECQEKTVALQ